MKEKEKRGFRKTFLLDARKRQKELLREEVINNGPREG